MNTRWVLGGVQLPPASLGTPSLPRAFSYTKKYCQDICFDNLYITTYFRQIDARRKKQVRGEMGQGVPPIQGSPPPPGPPTPPQGCTEPPCSPFSQNKRTLLPLRRAEIPTVIFPCRLAMQPRELQSVVRGWGGDWGSGVGVPGAGRGGPHPAPCRCWSCWSASRPCSCCCSPGAWTTRSTPC